MRIRTLLPACILLLSQFALAFDADYQREIESFLQANFNDNNVGMVIALIDQDGTRLIAAGKRDNGTDAAIDGDTLFEIGSITKTFTSLLMLEMDQRGEMKLEDAVSEHLPVTVQMPAREGKQITLLHLAEQSSGLPFDADNLKPKDPARRFEDYTVENLYTFLSGYTLKHDPGEQFRYSNAGMGLLGHVIERRAGKSLDTLFVERICTPLKMDSTRITLTPQLAARLAVGHDKAGKPTPNWDFQAMAGAGALRSSANDLAKYVSAQLGLTPSPLTPLMEKSHIIRHTGARLGEEPFEMKSATPWFDQGVYQPAGSKFLGHGGGTAGYSTFVGLDLGQRRGVVVLCNQREAVHSMSLGWRILQGARIRGIDVAKITPLRQIVGIGAALELDKPTRILRVTSVMPDSPAAKAGVPAGALVQKIDDVPTKDKTMKDCLDLLRGPAGTKVRLEMASAPDGDPRLYELTREKIMIGL